MCDAWFLFEFFIRFSCCPQKLKFLSRPFNVIDLVIVITFTTWIILSSFDLPQMIMKILNISKIFLLFKISRHSASLKKLGETIKKSSKELSILLVYLTIGVIFFSSIVFYCEKDTPEFSSIPATFW